ncbi:hypothetical protein [Sphaerotilus mobilis]|uniref:Uncharacterized protein n=1 Tax=Sphaerotilus mobilis TaxID=47994 RepID=A0A4Q7LL34_9BURK|nr:hypothetical protein [Sphaerotilus mobilis]RZS54932.1 hypothetical protein EV685_2418 [Sphaerotilus mobilis]
MKTLDRDRPLSHRQRMTLFVAAHLSLPILAYGTALAIGHGHDMPPVPAGTRQVSTGQTERSMPDVALTVAAADRGSDAAPAGLDQAKPWRIDTSGRISWQVP